MGIVITTNAQGMGIINCYSIVLYGDLVQEIGRAGRDGMDSVAMVQYNSYTCNLWTGEPEVKAVVTSIDCRRLAKYQPTHKCFNICAKQM